MARAAKHPQPPGAHAPTRSPGYVFEVLPGLAPFARAELESLGVRSLRAAGEDSLEGSWPGDPSALLELRRVVAAYARLVFAVPRPRALLGDEHRRRLVAAINEVRALFPPAAFSSFRFGAAGRDSGVFARLAEALTTDTGLRHDPEDGELLLRVRPSEPGWEVLVRLSPRPLSARGWRVCNLPGGLNATLAVVINDLAMNDLVLNDLVLNDLVLNDLVLNNPAGSGAYLNAMCGSGTLLVERALHGPAARLVGCDLSEQALECSRQNLAAAGVLDRVTLLRADAGQLPLGDDSFAAITCDLPWGDAVGSHQENAALYPAFLAEAARVGRLDARLALLTHDLKLFARVMTAQRDWRVAAEHRVFHGGHYPRLYLLERA